MILQTEEGKVLFCASDVAKALGYSNDSKAIKDHCRWVTKRYLPHPQSPSKKIQMSFIPEGDVYRLITHSKLPSAEKFESWVFDEVLPLIRKHGVYVDDEPWFVAADVCRALEIGNPSDALRRLDDDERQTTLVLIEGGYGAKSEKEVNIVSESGLYSLVLGSRKPEAKEFKRLITHEVIPSIRDYL